MKLSAFLVQFLTSLLKVCLVLFYPVFIFISFISFNRFPLWLAVILLIIPACWVLFWQNINKNASKIKKIFRLSAICFFTSVFFLVLLGDSSRFYDQHILAKSYAGLIEFTDGNNISGVGVWEVILTHEDIENSEVQERLDDISKRMGSEIIVLTKGDKFSNYLFAKVEPNLREKLYSLKEASIENVALYFSINELPQYMVNFKNNSKIAGPSAGLALALDIAVQEKGLELKQKVVATGEIDSTGNVLSVGSTGQKVIGADQQGAEVFIYPAQNQNEVEETIEKFNLEIIAIPVSTIEEAIIALEGSI